MALFTHLSQSSPAPRPRPPQHLSNLIREDKIRFLVGTWTRCWNSSALLYRFQSPARGRPPRSSAQGQHVRDDSVFRERPGNQRPQLRGSSRPLCLVGMLYPRQEAKARETSLFSFLLSKVVVTMAIKCYSSKRTKELLVGLGIFAIIQVELWGWKGDRFLILLRFDFPDTIASSATCKHQKGFVRGPRVFPHQPGLPSVSHHRAQRPRDSSSWPIHTPSQVPLGHEWGLSPTSLSLIQETLMGFHNVGNPPLEFWLILTLP